MPNKIQTGNSPIGSNKLDSKDSASAFARTENELGRRTPLQSMTTGSIQLPNGRMHVPRRLASRRQQVSSGCVPWKPKIFDDHDYEAAPEGGPDYKVRLNPGTINGVINASWNDLVDITDPVAADDLNYIIVIVTFTDKQVTSVAYSVSSTIPTAAELNPIAEESFPSQVKIILGTLVGTSACMVWTDNINVNAVEVFKETIENPAENVKPYKSWYRFQISAATA